MKNIRLDNLKKKTKTVFEIGGEKAPIVETKDDFSIRWDR